MATHDYLTIHRPRRWSVSRTAMAQEPVPLEELKAHANITAADDDALISGYIRAAREWVENYTQRFLITTTVTYKIDAFPAKETAVIELPGGKIQSVTSIAYVDTAGASQTWAAAEYIVDAAWEPARIGLAYDQDWPTIREWDLPITITYVAGYGADPGDVPENLRTAIKIVAAELYEHSREDSIVGVPIATAPWNARMLASNYRLRRLV